MLDLQWSNYVPPTHLPPWNARKGSLIIVPEPVLGMYIKDKCQVSPCPSPSSTKQSEWYSQTVKWIMSLPCSIPSSGFPMHLGKNLQGIDCGFISEAALPSHFLTPPSEALPSVILLLWTFPLFSNMFKFLHCHNSFYSTSVYPSPIAVLFLFLLLTACFWKH